MPNKYKNITVSSTGGAGSSTLAKSLAKELGWKYFSGGDFMRAYAIEHGLFDDKNKQHHDATVYGEELDKQVDFTARETMENKEGYVIDSWLSGFMAQGVTGTLKVLVHCSEENVRIDRIMNRDKLSLDEAKKYVNERESKNLAKWVRMYDKEWQEWVVNKHPGLSDKIYFWNPEIYDLVLDTYKLGPREAVEAVLDVLKKA